MGGKTNKGNLMDKKNWFTPVKRPLMHWWSAVKQSLVWLMTGDSPEFRGCGRFEYQLLHLNSGYWTTLAIIPTAQGQICGIQKGVANV